MDIQRTVLANGLTVISHHRPGSHSVALGLWLLNGSRHEKPDQHGYAHLLEHLYFKGCGELDALAVARLTDRWGGQVNAFTGRELTALYGLVPAARQRELTELLVSMVLAPRFSSADLQTEQGVILQEMAAEADSPEQAAETRLVELACAGHPFGRDILGSAESISAASVEKLSDYRRQLLTGARLAVVAVGAVDHDTVLKAAAPLAALPVGARPTAIAPRLIGGEHRHQESSEQTHLLWLMPAPLADGPGHATAAIANHLLGDGASSRLFQALRERLGLVYDIHSRLETYSDCGLWFIQTACRPEDADRCRSVVEGELAALTVQGPEPAELAAAREHMESVLQLELDAAEAHMESLAREHFYLGHHPDLEERLAELAEVDAGAVQALLHASWDARLHLTWG